MSETNVETTPELFDIFGWANQSEQYKKQFEIELFVFNKHFTPFRLNLDHDLVAQAKAFFLYDMMNFVTQGAETGLNVVPYEAADKARDIILLTQVGKVERASYLMDFFNNRQGEIVDFSNDEHEFRFVKGIVARLSVKDETSKVKPFYIIKQLSASQAVSGPTAWQINGSKVSSHINDVSIKIPLDNQVLIVGNQILVFNQSRFERLFSYDYNQLLIAEEKIAAIEERFKLILPDGLTIQALAKERKRTITKLQKLELTEMNQQELIDYADAMQLELMTDKDNAIIIMDGNDLDVFISLLNEDYMLATVTNRRYEIMAKKVLAAPDGEPPRG